MAHRALRSRLGRSPQSAQPVPAAEPEAAQRLSGALRHHADRYRSDAALDFTLLDALVRMDELEAAAQTLEVHRESLQALARDLQEAVADAAEERDAAVPISSATGLGIRRRLMAVTSAAAVVLTLVLPAGRTLPRTILAAVESRLDTASDDAPVRADQAPRVRPRADRRRDAERVSTPDLPGLGNTVARNTVRAILAVDSTGGSAARDQPQPAEVISLDAARAARRAASSDDPGPSAGRGALPPAPESAPAEESPLDVDVLDIGVDPIEPDLPTLP